MSERELTRQRVRFGFLFQQAALFDSMTVAQNVAFPLREHSAKPRTRSRRSSSPGWPRSACDRRIGQEAGGTFRGDAQTGGLGEGLTLEPELMLYDEPTTGLDPIMSERD